MTHVDLAPDAHLGAHLKKLRVAAGLSIRQLASEIGMSDSGLSKMERTTFPNPELHTMLLLQRALNLTSIEELLGDPPRPAMPSERLAAAAQPRRPRKKSPAST